MLRLADVTHRQLQGSSERLIKLYVSTKPSLPTMSRPIAKAGGGFELHQCKTTATTIFINTQSQDETEQHCC